MIGDTREGENWGGVWIAEHSARAGSSTCAGLLLCGERGTSMREKIGVFRFLGQGVTSLARGRKMD